MAISRAKGNNKVTIKIPRPLYDKIAAAIADSGYNSVTDFVVYVLRDLVASHAAPTDPDDLGRVQRRLEALGYLDGPAAPTADSPSSVPTNQAKPKGSL